ncbi:inositol-1-monophosphatase [Echinimonas agarilytica]|uniref:Inositol-1-monophosphatase n=1 Tax=Echinimonas agarilytica TaxID=1215918 RepID=A0AA42B892_9GAMM|nr:inositol-1-monophosphatase [Echinimonas agarilytica]MCM2680153.1 inositol-1-monophosphatase [Echinimonas agarilytica]
MHPMLNIAVRAARAAGSVILKGYEQLDRIETEIKGTNDFVTNIDRDAEQAIIQTIKKAYPDHNVVAEESGITDGADKDFQWIIDPLDGTTNFVRGVPHFAVSIALKFKGKLDQAVVYDPIRDELFTASRGAGAQLNGYRIRVSKAQDLKGTLLGTGFPFKAKHHFPAYQAMFAELFEDAADIRRAGSAALDMAYVAAGRLDGFWEIGLKPWDTAAGELLVREAGGIICDFAGGHNHSVSGNTVAASPRVTQRILKAIKPHLGEGLAR